MRSNDTAAETQSSKRPRTGAALEINTFPDRLDLNDDLVRRARDHGVLFAIDTDSHAVGHLD